MYVCNIHTLLILNIHSVYNNIVNHQYNQFSGFYLTTLFSVPLIEEGYLLLQYLYSSILVFLSPVSYFNLICDVTDTLTTQIVEQLTDHTETTIISQYRCIQRVLVVVVAVVVIISKVMRELYTQHDGKNSQLSKTIIDLKY